MSLHTLANHMAATGRGPDSMLVHMSPREVQSLQALAEKNGGTLTINPQTGLPEAGFLDAILPMVAGFALGPAGFALMSPLAAAATVGGITALSTRDLGKGLMAGFGAYGGAGLGAGLAEAGTGALAAGNISAQQAAGTFPELAAGASQEQIAKYAADVGGLRDAALSGAGEAGLGAKAAAGMDAITTNPGAYAKDAVKYGLAAISPMMADQGVQTTTPRPTESNIRRFSYDPYSGQYESQGMYPAAQDKGMASGGIASLANGGAIAFADGGINALTSDPAWAKMGAADKIAAFNNAGITADVLGAPGTGVSAADIAWMQQNGYTGAPAAAAQAAPAAAAQAAPAASANPAPGSEQYNTNVANWFTANPNATYADILKAEDNYLKPADIAAAMQKAGLSGAAIYAATNEKIGDTRNVDETYGGLKGLSSNINYWITNHPGASLNDFQNEMKKWELDENDVKRATGKTSTQLYTGPITEVVNPAEGAGGSTGAGAVGGGTVVNPNGTITTSPVIPGIPIGGFTGMTQVKDAYTTGGGSLGYTPYVPKDMADFNALYNKQSGDSAAMYDYLTGKSSVYPAASQNKELMKPYSEAVLGIQPAAGRPTQKYIYDSTTQTYKANPDYVPVTYDNKGNQSYGLTSKQITEYLRTNSSASDASKYDWAKANSIDVATLASLMGKTLAEVQAGLNGSKATSGSALVPATGGTRGTSDTTADTGSTTIYTGGSKNGGLMQSYAGGGLGSLGGYSDGGRLLRGPGDGVSDSIPASIGNRQPARLADGEFVVPARIVSELGNGSTEAGARKLYAMMDRVQQARGKTTGKDRVATNSRSDKYLPA